MSWKSLFKARVVQPVKEVKPIDQQTCAKSLAVILLPMGVVTLLVSLLFIHLSESGKAAEAFYLVLSFTVFFLIMGMVKVVPAISRIFNGRILSIDPEVKLGRVSSLAQNLVFYASVLFVPFVLFLVLTPPRLFLGKMTSFLRFVTVAILVVITVFLVSLVTFTFPQGKAKELASKVQLITSYYFLGPASYFIVELVSDVNDVIDINEKYIADVGLFLEKTAGVCRVSSVHNRLVSTLVKKSKEKVVGLEDSESEVFHYKNMIKSLRNCELTPMYPLRFNPMWTLQYSNILEGALMLSINSFLENITRQKMLTLLEEKLVKLSSDEKNQVEAEELFRDFRETHYYKNAISIRSSYLSPLFRH